MYGGGQFELGPGRRQIQKLASVFYADGPNDVAPSEYNDGPAREGLPRARCRRRTGSASEPVRRVPGQGASAFASPSGASARSSARALGRDAVRARAGRARLPYHWHFGEEEWLLVVSGAPTLRTPEGERVLAPWDVAAFRARRGGRARGAERLGRARACRHVLDRVRPRGVRLPGQRQGRRLRRLEPHGRAAVELMNRPEANLDYFDGET